MSDEYEKSIALYEAERMRNRAWHSWFAARGDVSPSDENTRIFDGGFRMAWELYRVQLTAAELEALRMDAARWRFVAQFMQLDDVGDDQYCLGLTVDHEALEEMVTVQAARLDVEWADVQGPEDNPKTLPPISLEEAIDAAIAQRGEGGE